MSFTKVRMRLFSVGDSHHSVWPPYTARAWSWWSPEGSPRPRQRHLPTSEQSFDPTWYWWMEWKMMSQMCLIRFRSWEQASKSTASMPSSCRNCRHTAVTGGGLSCVRKKSGYGLTRGLKISSVYHGIAMRPSKKNNTPHINDPLLNGWMLLPGSLLSATCSA